MRLAHLIIAAIAASFAGSAMASWEKAQQHDANTVRQVQEKLSAKGHDTGGAEGVWGPQTEKALKDFQQAQGIEPSGELDQRTLSALGVEAGPSASGEGAGAAAGGTAEPSPKGEAPKRD